MHGKEHKDQAQISTLEVTEIVMNTFTSTVNRDRATYSQEWTWRMAKRVIFVNLTSLFGYRNFQIESFLET